LREAPVVTALPALDRGYVTFGCFNRPAKIDRRFVEVWKAILDRLPTARLLLSNGELEEDYHRTRITSFISEVGIDSNRVEMMGNVFGRVGFLARYGLVDISLDPLGFNGGMTSFESLWQGVPVLTCPSDYSIGRMTLLMLTHLDLTDWAPPNLDAYVDRAVSAATDLTALAALRAGLRERVAASRLVDAEAYGKELGDLLVRIANGPERPR
jgi:predicted O-linked N-acetylglucosamine transferase (SPINDLY family)